MLRLKNRNSPIPNGNQFYDANLKYRSRQGMSFQGICDGLRIARLANPGITNSKGLATDKAAIEAEVDLYLATVCKSMGWTDYYLEGDGGSPTPFPQGRNRPPVTYRPQAQASRPAPKPAKLANVVAGLESVVDWIASGAEAVPQEQAEKRAEICSQCPLNGRGGWEKWFTIPASNAIRSALRHKGEFKLATKFDDQLGVCEACSCPMPLKVWVPLDRFFPHMSQEAKDNLDKGCWIRLELANQKP